MFTRLLKILLFIAFWFLGAHSSYAQKHKIPPRHLKDKKHRKSHESPFSGFKNHPGNYNLDSILQYINNNDEAMLIEFIKRQEAFINDPDEERKRSMVYFHLGRIYHHFGMLYLATENYLKSLELFQDKGMIIKMVEVSLHLSKINVSLKAKENNEVILKYLLPHLNSFDSQGKRNAVHGIIAETYLSSALICKNLGNKQSYNLYLDSAEYYFDFVIPTKKNPPFLGIAEVKMEKGKYKEVLPILLKRRRYKKDLGPGINEKVLMNIVRCYLAIKDHDAAYFYIKELRRIINGPFLPGKIEGCELVSELYQKMKQPDSAFHYLKKAYVLRDIMENEKLAKFTNELNIKYQSERKDILLASQKNKLGKLNKTVVILIISTLIVLFVLVLNYKNYLQKKKSNLLLKYKNQMIVEQSRQLEKLTNYKESLTSMIVHDLKNPINSIIGLSTDFLIHKNLKVIHNSGKKMLSLVLNILDVQKFEEARFELHIANSSVNELVQSAIKETDYLSKEKNIEILFESDINYFVNFDFEIIQRVIINIITNAIKYSDFNKEVILKVFPSHNDTLSISIIDEGMGIPEDQIPHVFDKFWQYKSKKSGGVRSVGLGLTFCKMAVDAHNGNINVKSILGKGTTFTVCLPHVNSYQIVTQDTKKNHDSLGEKYNHNQLVYLEKFAKKLRRYKAYEISEILNVLSQIDAEDMQIRSWKEEMENIIISGNNKQFKLILDRLLDISNHQQ